MIIVSAFEIAASPFLFALFWLLPVRGFDQYGFSNASSIIFGSKMPIADIIMIVMVSAIFLVLSGRKSL